jgi:hypothetical protein
VLRATVGMTCRTITSSRMRRSASRIGTTVITWVGADSSRTWTIC